MNVVVLPSVRPRLPILLVAIVASAAGWRIAQRSIRRPAPIRGSFVGRSGCVGCHPEQDRLWTGSHHAFSMQPADRNTILGDFSGVTYTAFGVSSFFFRRGEKFLVRTDGPDGSPREYPIEHAFGVAPLQQYLIPFPGGRFQAFSLAWDSRPKREGGQRWFHLYPNQPIPASDVLHWTKPSQNWNYMCAECHSTNLRKGYQVDRDRYETTFSEVNVACEACHGPGSVHVASAKAYQAGRAWPDPSKGLTVRLRDEVPGRWVFDPGAAIARRDRPREARREVETCARCHARRGVISDDYVYGRPLLDTHRPSLLEEGLYHADGQIQDEVYEYGSFLQSRMYAAGVTCSDCHDPHRLRFEGPSDAACGRCHLPARYFRREHHFHPPGKPGRRCVECHMIERTYMVVDRRRDHSFRVPRPDLSQRIGTPNACNDCHRDKTARWASSYVVAWYGPSSPARRPHYAEVLAAGRGRLPHAENALAELIRDLKQPAIVRATALELLAGGISRSSWTTIELAVVDDSPLVRAASVAPLETVEPSVRIKLLLRLLADPVRGVRIEAGRALADSRGLLRPPEREALHAAVAEYRAAQAANADRAEAHVNLANLEARLGKPDVAVSQLEQALRLNPSFVPASVNLADIYRQQGREREAEMVLRRGLEAIGADAGAADLYHALGLALARQGRTAEAIPDLERAAEARPEEPRFAFVLAVALESRGERQRALSILRSAHRLHPGDRDLLGALATMSRDAGDRIQARAYARQLIELFPDDSEARRLAAAIEQSG